MLAEVKSNNLNPVWRDVSVSLASLCNGDMYRPLKLGEGLPLLLLILLLLLLFLLLIILLFALAAHKKAHISTHGTHNNSHT